MYQGKKILLTICARGGSKGVKNKNIRLLNGIPVIGYTLELIKKSKYIDGYVISTDSEDIIDVIKRFGFEVKFKRPVELAGDKVGRIDVIKHAARWISENEDLNYDIIVDAGVATPLKNADDLDGCIKLLVDSNSDNVFSVTPSSRNPYYNMVEIIHGRVRPVKDVKTLHIDRQDVPVTYDENDGFNVWKYDMLFSQQSQYNDTSKIYIMPRERSVDIDEEIDFIIAEALAKLR